MALRERAFSFLLIFVTLPACLIQRPVRQKSARGAQSCTRVCHVCFRLPAHFSVTALHTSQSEEIMSSLGVVLPFAFFLIQYFSKRLTGISLGIFTAIKTKYRCVFLISSEFLVNGKPQNHFHGMFNFTSNHHLSKILLGHINKYQTQCLTVHNNIAECVGDAI